MKNENIKGSGHYSRSKRTSQHSSASTMHTLVQGLICNAQKMHRAGVIDFPAQLSGKGRTIDELKALFDYLLLPFEGNKTLDYMIAEKTHAMSRVIQELDEVALLLATECSFALASVGYSAGNMCLEKGQVFRIYVRNEPDSSYYDCHWRPNNYIKEKINASYDDQQLGKAVARAHAIMIHGDGENLLKKRLRHVVCYYYFGS
jgi:hypothetical protein